MTESVLAEAARIIDGDRAEAYGDVAESFNRIAGLWSSYLGSDVTDLDVANLMILLKVSRTKGKYHRDSYVDISGYSGLAERLEDGPKATPRQWNALDEVPEGVLASEKDGDMFEWRHGDIWWRPEGGEWRRSHTQDSEEWEAYAPWTEVLCGD